MENKDRDWMWQADAITERHLQAIWYDGTLRPQSLRTVDGAGVKVLDPGMWNLEAGPDFLHATVDVDGTRLCGDVEVHLRPGDWFVHRHARDPAYSKVVAHVTWHGGEQPAGPDGLPPGCIGICLGDTMRTQPGFSPLAIDLGAYPYAHRPAAPRPCETRFAGNPDAVEAVLRTAGRLRILEKSHRMAARFMQISREQTFYEETFAALGYKYNAFPFRDVARALSWRDLPDDPQAALTCYNCIAGMKVVGETPWRRANVRPANAPARRLAAAAALFCQGPSLCGRLLACDLAGVKGQRQAVAILRETRMLGPGRAGAIMANAVVPYALAVEALGDVPEWIFPEDVSAPVRLAAFHLLGRDHNPAFYSGNGLLIQGLIHIQRTCCEAALPDCSDCRLGRL